MNVIGDHCMNLQETKEKTQAATKMSNIIQEGNFFEFTCNPSLEHQQEQRKLAQVHQKIVLPLEQIQQVYCYAFHEAALILKIDTEVLKQHCRFYGIKRFVVFPIGKTCF